MVWVRYVAYFIGILLITAILTQLEAAYPGSLRLQVFTDPTDVLGTSEFSPLEMIQLVVLVVCGALMGWVAEYCPQQRPLAFLFGGMALAFLVRELDYFLDRYVADNFWQVVIAIIGALLIAYALRNRLRIQIALARIWPSPGLTLLFAGALVLFCFSLTIGHEPLWQSIFGDAYRRSAKLAIEEFIELIGYALWLIGTIEYTYQARAAALREPVPAARRRREHRRREHRRRETGGRY